MRWFNGHRFIAWHWHTESFPGNSRLKDPRRIETLAWSAAQHPRSWLHSPKIVTKLTLPTMYAILWMMILSRDINGNVSSKKWSYVWTRLIGRYMSLSYDGLVTKDEQSAAIIANMLFKPCADVLLVNTLNHNTLTWQSRSCISDFLRTVSLRRNFGYWHREGENHTERTFSTK